MESVNDIADAHTGIRDFFYILFRHKKKIIIFFLLVMSVVMITTFLTHKTYRSEAKLFIKLGREMVPQDSGASPAQRVLVSQTLENQINSEIEILLGQELAVKVVQNIGVAAFQKNSEQYGTSVNPLADKINSFVKMASQWPHQIMAKFLAPKNQEVASTENNEIEMTALALRSNLRAQVINDSNIINVSYENHSARLARDVLSQLISGYMDLHMKLHSTPESFELFQKESNKFKAQLEATEKKIESQKNKIGAGYTTAAITDLNNVIYELKLKEQELLATFTETSIPVQEIRKQIKQAQARLNSQLEKNNSAEVQLTQLEREKDRLEKNYRKYSDALEQTRIDQALEAEKISNIRIAQPPDLPLEPIRPRSGLILALGFFLAVFGSLGLAFFANYMDSSLQKPEQVEQILDIPVLGSIQEMRS